MQDRYAADIGDYGKLGLLRALAAADLSIGVQWYRRPDETQNGDGRFVGYLTEAVCRKTDYRACDPLLWEALRAISLPEKRSVAALQDCGILRAAYYGASLDFSGLDRAQRTAKRLDWHRTAVKQLQGCDLIFADPDNGLLVPSARGTRRENKYVTIQELEDFYRSGASVVYYQHQARHKDAFYVAKHRELLGRQTFADASGFGLKFCKQSSRYYFFLVHPAHRVRIQRAVQRMVSPPWKLCFTALEQ